MLDEPTEGIQPNIVEQIEDVIGSLRGRMAILLVEQFLDFALSNAGHCYVMAGGEVVLHGAPADLGVEQLRDLVVGRTGARSADDDHAPLGEPSLQRDRHRLRHAVQRGGRKRRTAVPQAAATVVNG
ncbi:MAG: hypothetical protein WD734_01815 [Dehalococcoidia bacterium]